MELSSRPDSRRCRRAGLRRKGISRPPAPDESHRRRRARCRNDRRSDRAAAARGNVEGLRGAARSLDRVAARARSTLTVRGTLGARLRAVWTGDAATAAGAEAAELGRRCQPVVEALPAAARALRAYAAALDHATARWRSLQRQWDALDAEHLLTALRLAALPDPTGTTGVLGMERSRADQAAGRARLSRAYSGVIDELRTTATPVRRRHHGRDRRDVPAGRTVGRRNGAVRRHRRPVLRRRCRRGSTGVARRRPRRQRAGAPDAGSGRGRRCGSAARRHGRADREPGQGTGSMTGLRADLLSELGADGFGSGAPGRGRHAERVGCPRRRRAWATRAFGSLLITATSHRPPVGTDPRTRAQLASGAALLADDLVAGGGHGPCRPFGKRSRHRGVAGGQLLSGARAAGDDRRLPHDSLDGLRQRSLPPRSPRPATRTRRCGTAPPCAPTAREPSLLVRRRRTDRRRPARPARERGATTLPSRPRCWRRSRCPVPRSQVARCRTPEATG